MAYKIAITFDAAAVKASDREAAPICALFMPTNAAADMDVFEDTYYDTNVHNDYGTELDDFLAMQVSHPGLVAAMRKAAKDGSYVMTTDDPMMETMIDGLNATMAAAGFKFEWQGETGATGETGETGATGETGETGPTGA